MTEPASCRPNDLTPTRAGAPDRLRYRLVEATGAPRHPAQELPSFSPCLKRR